MLREKTLHSFKSASEQNWTVPFVINTKTLLFTPRLLWSGETSKALRDITIVLIHSNGLDHEVCGDTAKGRWRKGSRLGWGSDPSLALHQGWQAAGHMQCLQEPWKPGPSPGWHCCLRGGSRSLVSGVPTARRWEIWF